MVPSRILFWSADVDSLHLRRFKAPQNHPRPLHRRRPQAADEPQVIQEVGQLQSVAVRAAAARRGQVPAFRRQQVGHLVAADRDLQHLRRRAARLGAGTSGRHSRPKGKTSLSLTLIETHILSFVFFLIAPSATILWLNQLFFKDSLKNQSSRSKHSVDSFRLPIYGSEVSYVDFFGNVFEANQ